MAKKPTYKELAQRVKELEREALERTQAKKARRQSEANYGVLFSAGPDPIVVMDAETEEIVDANRAALALYGYNREELVGLRATELSAEPQRSAAHMKQVVSGKPSSPPPRPVQCLHRKKNGTIFPVEISLGVCELQERKMACAFIRDIVAHKRAEALLERSNIAMLDMLESISDGFFSLNGDLIVTYFNAAAGRLLGRKSWEVLGHSFYKAFPQFKGSIFEKKFTQVLHEKTALSFETHFDVKPYKNWYEVRIYPQEDGISVYFRVTSERKRAEEEKRKLEAQLQQAQKMKAVGALAGGIANDFNNLLSVIQASASLMLLDIDASHPHYENLRNIEKQIQQGSKLSAQLLGYAGKGRYDVRTIDINQLVAETSETFGKARRKITIHHEFAHDLFTVEADRSQIEQVLRDLLANAVDAMPDGGDLTLKTANVTHKDMGGHVHDPKPGYYVRLTVTDTGAGMDKETQARIFEPFFTTKKDTGATGIGLASAYGIVEGHRGYIDVHSEKGRGTSFNIYLQASEKKVKKTLSLPDRLIAGTGTVLLVDDELMVLELGMKLLEKLGYTVIQAKGGREAVEIYKTSPDSIDLVILDMIMPDMGGGETYDRIKEINPGVKVILSTGYSTDGRATEILERGCDGFLPKPYTIRELSASIEEVLRKTGVTSLYIM
jgi:two-component system cell cycle sensor histidine kinase/response regulator CckA